MHIHRSISSFAHSTGDSPPKANSLVAEPPESLKRNYSKKKANAILNDIKNCISPEVFVLCALAANPSALGTAKLGDYVSTIGRWWERASHPKGLTMVSERYRIRISKTSALVRGVYQQHANQSNPGMESPFNDEQCWFWSCRALSDEIDLFLLLRTHWFGSTIVLWVVLLCLQL